MAEFLTVRQIADKLDVTEITVRGYIKQGMLRSTKVARKHLISQEHLDEFLSNASSDDVGCEQPQGNSINPTTTANPSLLELNIDNLGTRIFNLGQLVYMSSYYDPEDELCMGLHFSSVQVELRFTLTKDELSRNPKYFNLTRKLIADQCMQEITEGMTRGVSLIKLGHVFSDIEFY